MMQTIETNPETGASVSASTAAWTAGGTATPIFSGHESFAFRYGWLPKLYEAVSADPQVFASDERAILQLGLGKNMVRALRFWANAFGLTTSAAGATRLTDLAHRLLDPEIGIDPYLEEAASLWRLHWRITTHANLGAWGVAFLDTHDVEIPRAKLVERVRSRSTLSRATISPGTAAAHVDIMLATYDASRAADGVREETLGCPMQELGLLRTATPGGASTVRFSRGRKAGLDVGAFAFALHDFWSGTAPSARSISVRSLSLSRRAPGPVFRLDETALHERLDAVCARAPALTLREDGAGGVDLFATGRAGPDQLEGLAW